MDQAKAKASDDGSDDGSDARADNYDYKDDGQGENTVIADSDVAVDIDVGEEDGEEDDDDRSGDSRYQHSSRLNEQNLLRIHQNDPTIISLDVRFGHGFDFDASNIDWERDGDGDGDGADYFANNTHLKKLSIDGWIENLEEEPARENRKAFYRALARNRSIRHLNMIGSFIDSGEMFSILAAFFEHNGNIRSFRADGVEMDSASTRMFASSVQRWNKNSLREFHFNCNDGMEDASAAELSTALDGLLNLKYLTLSLEVSNDYEDDNDSNGSVNGKTSWCAALAGLLQNPKSKLVDLDLDHSHICDDGLAILANSLTLACNNKSNNNNSLRNLSLEGNDSITPSGWRYLSSCLERLNCSLEVLNLSGCGITDSGLVALGNALVNKNNKSLKTLHLTDNQIITDDGWRMFFMEYLQCFSSLETLMLDHNSIRDEGAFALGHALTCNKTLKSLFLRFNSRITELGWIAFAPCLESSDNSNSTLQILDLCQSRIDHRGLVALANALSNNTDLKQLSLRCTRHVDTIGRPPISIALHNPSCALEKLDLGYNDIGDEGLNELAEALNNNTRITSLNLDGNRNITATGWLTFFNQLRNPRLVIQEIYLNHNHIGDGAVAAMVDALCNISTLKILQITGNQSITSLGWIAFSDLLRSLHVALEAITLDSKINDDVIASFANSLVNNSSLKTLWFSNISTISSRAWDSITDVICNETSISSIYNSNHILQNICYSEDNLPNRLVSNLRLNRNENKHEVARSKILRYFMKGNAIQDFDEIELKVWPRIIAMISNDRAGQPVLYQLFRSMPSLLNSFH